MRRFPAPPPAPGDSREAPRRPQDKMLRPDVRTAPIEIKPDPRRETKNTEA